MTVRSTSAGRCELSEVDYQAWPAPATVTVRCRIRTVSGATAEGHGTDGQEPLARRKAFSEAVERLAACSPLAPVVRPPTPTVGDRGGLVSGPSGLRAAPPDCLLRRYHPPAGGRDREVPMFWSSPWIAGEELRTGTLRSTDARLASTIGWAAAPDAEAALSGALLELTESVDYGVHLYRGLAAPPYRPPASQAPPTDGARTLSRVTPEPEPELILLRGITATPTVLAVARSEDRSMPATGLGSGPDLQQAGERALMELEQARTLWRLNLTAESAEREFLRRFERWPALMRCVCLDFDLRDPDGPAGTPRAVPPRAPLRELTDRSLSVWADRISVDLFGPDLPPTRLHLAHVVTDPQPLLGLVRAGIPVFDTGEVRRTLAPDRTPRPADSSDLRPDPLGRHTTRA
ncbi:YcaO-like family protein [Streptomyces sp. B21-083]|uniref:YcaO-like family protein n=1 Tax=Streptomyces sp. B21-083 TaxID=3039410 RepID=UPI002FEEA24B